MKTGVKNISLYFWITITVMLSFSFGNKGGTFHYKTLFSVPQNCAGDTVEIKVEIWSEAENIGLTNFFSPNKTTTFYYGSKLISKSDVFYVGAQRTVFLTVRYVIEEGKENWIIFNSNSKQQPDGVIKINHGEYTVPVERPLLDNNTEYDVPLTSSCNDSLRVYFPYGGTITSISLNKFGAKDSADLKWISYGMHDKNNYMSFAKSDTGRYAVMLSACHWGGHFILNLK